MDIQTQTNIIGIVLIVQAFTLIILRLIKWWFERRTAKQLQNSICVLQKHNLQIGQFVSTYDGRNKTLYDSLQIVCNAPGMIVLDKNLDIVSRYSIVETIATKETIGTAANPEKKELVPDNVNQYQRGPLQLVVSNPQQEDD